MEITKPTDRPALTRDVIRAAPKVVLHDHLDGGLRPSTIVELAAESGYKRLPTTDAEQLRSWMHRGADRLSLALYLETFQHTTGVMQTKDALIRTAAECVEDLASDGVVYAEVRYAPEQHLEHGLTLDEVVLAVAEGLQLGTATARAKGQVIEVGALLCAMRQAARSTAIAELAVRHRDDLVVGFDIAGPEEGFPPSRHLAAFQVIHDANFHTTIHAGEAFGLPSIHEALQFCGAERLGHGVRIVDDIFTNPDGSHTLGLLANYVRDRRIPLEMCPTSNIHTAAAPSIAAHPIELLKHLKFRVTVNTDNRLMSNCSMTSEFDILSKTFGYTLSDMQWFTVNAMKSAFWPFSDRLRIIDTVIKPGYQRLIAQTQAVT